MRITENHWLISQPIAHRGLWNEQIVENSITAYQNAIDNGFPIEIDVYITKDNHLISFHDTTLTRMTGEEGYVYNKTLDQLKALCLNGTTERIPTFDEILSITENKVPILIEIKNQPNKKVVDAVVERLKNYSGEFAIQSFNPFYLKRVRQLAPEFLRGVLANPKNTEKLSFLQNWVIKKMPFNFLVKPDFLSICHEALPISKGKRKKRPILAWTLTSKDSANKALTYANNIIFEGFSPEKC